MGKKRLLIIEDDHDLGEMLMTFFHAKGYEVISATSGAEGITLARAKFPNLILLDVMLPDIEGFDVCRVLRSNTLTKYIPITFLTQRDARADKVAGLQLGADDYVTKPFDIEELRLRVERSIERATRDHLHEVRTGLPTSKLVESEYDRIQALNESWHTIYITIDGFDAFREVYGFLAADEAIALAANILTSSVAKLGTNNDFVGITERSSFVLFSQTQQIDELINWLTEQFSRRSRTLYSFTDVEQGFIIVQAGTDEETRAPLMHLVVSEYAPVRS